MLPEGMHSYIIALKPPLQRVVMCSSFMDKLMMSRAMGINVMGNALTSGMA
jgi:hypothetical protein